MNRREFVAHLRAHSCSVLREGKRHTIYHNAATNKTAPVPCHNTIARGLVLRICKELEIPAPGGD